MTDQFSADFINQCTITIGDTPITGRSISIQNDVAYVDGVKQVMLAGPINIVIHGNVANVKTMSGSVEVHGNCAQVKTMSGNINCENVHGPASSMSGNVNCKSAG